MRFVRPKREIVFGGRLRWIAPRLESDQCLLHVLRSTAKDARKERSCSLQIFQCRLRQRLAPRLKVELSETFARIPKAFGRIFLQQTGRKSDTFGG